MTAAEGESAVLGASLRVCLLDYGAGNVRSVRNAIRKVGFQVVDLESPSMLDSADCVIFPGVGSFGMAMKFLEDSGFQEPLKRYIEAGRPFLGICLGLQTLFEGSDECPGTKGLGIIKGSVKEFEKSSSLSVPHIGWNTVTWKKNPQMLTENSVLEEQTSEDSVLHTASNERSTQRMYFVHSYRALASAQNHDWVLGTTNYGGEFICAVQKGAVCATQFHPEKSGKRGLSLLHHFIRNTFDSSKNGPQRPFRLSTSSPSLTTFAQGETNKADERTNAQGQELAVRVIACLDVRSNDDGDLVVTKGDQYDVRERDSGSEKKDSGKSGSGIATEPHNPLSKPENAVADARERLTAKAEGDFKKRVERGSTGAVRNLGKPVDLCKRYYEEGADEVVFLNITSFREPTAGNQAMEELLRKASEEVFVPLTIGGGIREYKDKEGRLWTAMDVAGFYFRAGADKVSIGSDAVYAAERFLERGSATMGDSSIEQISAVYGRQAVVVSLDPRRVYVDSPEEAQSKGFTVVHLQTDGEMDGPHREGEAAEPEFGTTSNGKRKVMVDLSSEEQRKSSKGGEIKGRYCWYQATVKGGREGRQIDAVQVAKACEALGAGELLVNCVDQDGQGNGYDIPLLNALKCAVKIPVIASSGAGCPQHFVDVVRETKCEATLAAGIFHRKEVSIKDVKAHLELSGLPARIGD